MEMESKIEVVLNVLRGGSWETVGADLGGGGGSGGDGDLSRCEWFWNPGGGRMGLGIVGFDLVGRGRRMSRWRGVDGRKSGGDSRGEERRGEERRGEERRGEERRAEKRRGEKRAEVGRGEVRMY
jgi:hypothetical protein